MRVTRHLAVALLLAAGLASAADGAGIHAPGYTREPVTEEGEMCFRLDNAEMAVVSAQAFGIVSTAPISDEGVSVQRTSASAPSTVIADMRQEVDYDFIDPCVGGVPKGRKIVTGTVTYSLVVERSRNDMADVVVCRFTPYRPAACTFHPY